METLDQGSLGKMPIQPIKERWNLLAIGIIASVVTIGMQVMDAIKLGGLVKKYENGDYGAALELSRMQREGITPVKALIFVLSVVSIVFICMWVYRAAQNVHSAGMRSLNYSPGWNVGWFFIPLIHIVMPAIVIRETVKASQSINNREEYDSWQNNKAMTMFSVWAICFCLRMLVVYAIAGYSVSLVGRIAQQDYSAIIDLYKVATYVGYFTITVGLVELFALFSFSKKVTELQEQYRKED